MESDNRSARGEWRPRDYLERARAHLESGERKAALLLLSEARARYPENRTVCLDEAVQLQECGENGAAAGRFARLLKAHPDLGRPVYLRTARAQEDSGDLVGAARTLGEIEERFGINRSVALRKLALLDRTGQEAAWQLAMERALESWPGDPAVRQVILPVLLARRDYARAQEVVRPLSGFEAHTASLYDYGARESLEEGEWSEAAQLAAIGLVYASEHSSLALTRLAALAARAEDPDEDDLAFRALQAGATAKLRTARRLKKILRRKAGREAESRFAQFAGSYVPSLGRPFFMPGWLAKAAP